MCLPPTLERKRVEEVVVVVGVKGPHLNLREPTPRRRGGGRRRGTEKEMGREGDMIGRKARQKGVRVETMRQGDRDRVGEGGGGGSRFGARWGG